MESKGTTQWGHAGASLWNGLVSWVRQESAAATAIVQAFIALGIAFSWWHWSTAQTGAVIGIVAALLGMFVRSQVTPVARASARRTVAPAPPAPRAQAGPAAAGRPPVPTPPATRPAAPAPPPSWPTPAPGGQEPPVDPPTSPF